MLNTQLVIIGVVGGRYFQTTGTKIDGYVLVGNNRYLSANQRDTHSFTVQVQIPFIVGVNGNSHVGHDRFGPNGSNYKEVLSAGS